MWREYHYTMSTKTARLLYLCPFFVLKYNLRGLRFTLFLVCVGGGGGGGEADPHRLEMVVFYCSTDRSFPSQMKNFVDSLCYILYSKNPRIDHAHG